MKPTVSIIIPYYLGDEHIARCLQHVKLAAQGMPHELIVVASSAPPSVVTDLDPEIILILSQDRLSAGMARNKGIECSKGNFIAFLDQDCIVESDWLIRMTDRLNANENLMAIGGSVNIGDWNHLSSSVLYFLEFLYHFPCKTEQLREGFIIGCNGLFRRDFFKSLRFPDWNGGEDVVLCNMSLSLGYQIAIDPDISVTHLMRKSWRECIVHLILLGRAAFRIKELSVNPYHKLACRFPSLLLIAAPLLSSYLVACKVLQTRNVTLWTKFVLCLPGCILGSYAWALGFYKERYRKE